MEYDRALYRVYERVVEDLLSTRPVSTIYSGNENQEQRRGNHENLPIPFFLPIWFNQLPNRYLNLRHVASGLFSRSRDMVRNEDPETDTNNYHNDNSNTENQRIHSSQNIDQSNNNLNPLYLHHRRRAQQHMGDQHRHLLNNEVSTNQNDTTNNNNNNTPNRSYSTDESDDNRSQNSSTSNERERANEPIEETLRRMREDSRYDLADENTMCTQMKLYSIMRASFFLGFLHLVILAILHRTYVGAGVWEHNGLKLNRIASSPTSLDGSDEIHSRRKTCLEYALESRPPSQRSSFDEKYNRAYENFTQAERELRRPLLGLDEILQIKILYGGRCKGKCSRLRYVNYNNETKNNETKTEASDDETFHGNLRTNNRDNNMENEETDDWYSTPEFWETPHYRYASMEALLFLRKEFTLDHNLTYVNVTLTEHCLSTGFDGDMGTTKVSKIAEVLSQIYGMDTVIINQLMYGVRSFPPLVVEDSDDQDKIVKQKKNDKKKTTKGVDKDEENSLDYSSMVYMDGFVENIETTERWNWRKELLSESDISSPAEWFSQRIGMLVACCISFFLVTSITSLIVRVLTSSGVVLMFPIFSFLRHLGLANAGERILGLSYPWIGRARVAARNRNIHDESHLIWAHLAKIFLYYIMYEACQTAWSSVLYGKSVPEALPVWIFGFAMIFEYFTMVFLRSALSVYFFPRVTFMYFAMYHIYFYSVPYGYFDIALIPFFFFMLQAMLYCILSFELSAASRGVVSLECPREVYNRLSWAEWTSSLPFEWTLFLPLNSRYIPLHDREVMSSSSSSYASNGDSSSDSSSDDNSDNSDDDMSLADSDNRRNQEETNTTRHEVDVENTSLLHNNRSGLFARRNVTEDRN